MRRTWKKIVAGMLAGLSSLPALAQEEVVDAAVGEVERLTAVANMIRWSGVAASLVLILTSWFLLRILDNTLDGLGESFVQRRLLFQKIRAVVHFAVYLGTGVGAVFLSLRISNEVLALLGGSLAVAVGFAAKDLVASLVSGVLIMIDQPFQVGDRVSFGGFYGDITSIGLRSVRLQTLDDNTVTIPNNMFLTAITSCGNYGALDMQVVIDFHIAPDQDTQHALDLVRQAATTSRYVYLDKPVTVLVTEVIVESYIAVRLRLKVYVLDTRYEKALETDITLRVHDEFSKHGVQPPSILHRTITAPPAAAS
jgi:small-conductance mechanosensitive channel